MQYDDIGALCPDSATIDSTAQAHLDQLSWIRIPVPLIYILGLKVKRKALRVRMEMHSLRRIGNSGRLTIERTAHRFGLSRSSAEKNLRTLKKLGLFKNGVPVWPNAKGWSKLSLNETYSSIEKGSLGWFHRVPRLLISSLSEHALLTYLHLMHKALTHWSKGGPARSSSNEICSTLGMSKTYATKAINELRDLQVIADEGKGRFRVLGIHAANANMMKGHLWCAPKDLRLLDELGLRWHSFDRAAKTWFATFARDAEVSWQVDNRGVAFWSPAAWSSFSYRKRRRESAIPVPTESTPIHAIGCSLPWGYAPQGLRPPLGNKERETKGGLTDTPVSHSFEQSSDSWSSLLAQVPAFVTTKFLRFAMTDDVAGSWFYLWCSGVIVELGGLTNISVAAESGESGAVHRAVVHGVKSGQKLAELILAIHDLVEESSAKSFPLTLLSFLDFIAASKEAVNASFIERWFLARKPGRELVFTCSVAASSGASKSHFKFKEDFRLFEDLYNHYQSGEPSSVAKVSLEKAETLLSEIPPDLALGKERVLEVSKSVFAGDFNPRVWVWKTLKELRKKNRSQIDDFDYVMESWECPELRTVDGLTRRWLAFLRILRKRSDPKDLSDLKWVFRKDASTEAFEFQAACAEMEFDKKVFLKAGKKRLGRK